MSRDRRIALCLGLICLLAYNANLRTVSAGDSLPARYLPFGIWRYGSLLLDPIRDAVAEGHAKPYWIKSYAGHAVSFYPVVLPALVAPLYAPAVLYLQIRGWTDARLRNVAVAMEKLTASLLAACASALLYLLLRRRAPPAAAALLAFAFAFGTNTWMIGSQALWQHGLAELLLTGLLFLLSGPCTPGRVLAAGALCGLIAGNRPPDTVLAAALGVYGLHWAGRRAPWIVAGAIVPLALVVSYNFAVAGNIAGGYGLTKRVDLHYGSLEGIAGLLFSPARGLLIFSPFLILVPAALRRGIRDRDSRALTLAIGVGVLLEVLIYSKFDWRAGCAWGPRWLTDPLPLLIWMLPPALLALRRPGRLAFAAAVGASIAIQAVGAFWYTGASDIAIFTNVPGRREMGGAWDPANTPFIAELRHQPASPDPVFTRMFGSLREFGARAASVSLDRDSGLAAAARRAASLLGSHQQGGGFWLTAHTRTTRFENATPEMNTFLTAMIVDVLGPAAEASGLSGSFARAREHLSSQIEASGLVRYHGRPDAATIPALGCAITPDADDTALVWRLAGGDRRVLLPRALAALSRYRTPEGLYRTWLAPPEKYECIDPGKDPNPADVGIQMHVFLLLAESDPAAARALCGVLRGTLADDRIWVYYQVAPLVPVLRQADLSGAGCPLRIPQTRVSTSVEGQDVWLAAGRLLDRSRSADGQRPSSAETLALLGSLAKDGFSSIHENPPLMYHNDLTARTSRFYWSEDFGYALWLRLYFENARREHAATPRS